MTQVSTNKKNWFKLNKPNVDSMQHEIIVEYSTDFKFFTEHQLRIVKTGMRYNFCSRLEAKSFKTINGIGRKGLLSDNEIMHYAKIVHNEILKGEHGEGELVN